MKIYGIPGLALAGLLFGPSAAATEVYMARGAQGEASFSDFASPDAVVVDLQVQQPSPEQAELARQHMVESLAVAGELEAARLAREKAYAEKRAEAARRQTQYQRAASTQARYSGYGRPNYWHRFPDRRWPVKPGRGPGEKHRAGTMRPAFQPLYPGLSNPPPWELEGPRVAEPFSRHGTDRHRPSSGRRRGR